LDASVTDLVLFIIICYSTLPAKVVSSSVVISPAKDRAMSQEDVKAFHRLEAETRLLNNHYEVPMLWRHPKVQLPNNYVQTLKRWHLLVKRLLADRHLLSEVQSGS
jgi:hypothetical protein